MNSFRFRPTFFCGIFFILLSTFILSGCTNNTDTASDNTGLANPASTYCEDQGGTLSIQEKSNGQYGVCFFEENRQCEEWALFQGECPVGGVKVTGWTTDQQIYCAITGGTVDMKINTCKKGETVCDLTDYYNNACL
ncbi:MAG: DUF333 domain-containing protein [Candidatus Gracilibacteria bacterium]